MQDFYFSFGKQNKKSEILNSAFLWVWLEPLLDKIADFLNSRVLKLIDGRTLQIIFDEIDIFWLRNAKTKSYEESEIRLIIAMLIRCTADSNLSRKELLSIIDYIQRKWKPDIALAKSFTNTDEVIEARVEATVDAAIDLYKKKYEEKPLAPEEFVAQTGELILHPPDGSDAQSLLGGIMQIKSTIVES